ncbi:MAG TPA: hypothetical protein QGG37_06595, partial [Chloroflexota bacterium]|nr:hypothetical protein [Chloroflexota bacterium]
EYIGPDEGQLFDLQNDPEELNDLWDDPAQAERRAEMHRILHEWYITAADGIKYARRPGD